MTRGRRTALLVWSMVLMLAVTLQAGFRTPGEYAGRFVTDRWGRGIFFSGTTYFLVEEAAASGLTSEPRHPVLLDVRRIYQAANPGSARIQGAGETKRLPIDPDLVLDIQPSLSPPDAETGKTHATFTLSMRNDSDHDVPLSPGTVSAAVVVVWRPSEQDCRVTHGGPSPIEGWNLTGWCPPKGGDTTRLAWKEKSVRWSHEVFLERGRLVKKGTDAYRSVVIAPDGSFSADLAWSDLLRGEYQAYFYMHRTIRPKPGHLGPNSAWVSFDVPQRETAAHEEGTSNKAAAH